MPPIEWEDAPCLVCGGSDRAPADEVRWRDADFRYVICRRCGLKYMAPRPTERWYRDFYADEFWQEKIEYRGFRAKASIVPLPADEGLAKRLAKQDWRAERILSAVAPVVPLTAASLVVDVGTAFGVTLQRMRERWGCRVTGVEPSAVAREYAQQEFGLEFLGRHMEDLFEPTPVDGTVTLLIMSQVLENIIDPRAALRAVRRLLAADGVLYIDTSNFFYYNAINPYHPYIFSPATLEDLLAQSGFTVIAREHEPDPAVAETPLNPYLMLMARPGASAFQRLPVDTGALMAAQRLGLQKLADSKAARKRAQRRTETA